MEKKSRGPTMASLCWALPMLACTTVLALAAPSLGLDEDASREESLSLAAAVELAERRDLKNSERAQLAERGELSVTDQPDSVSAEFTLDDVDAVVNAKRRSDGRVDLWAQVSGISIDAKYDPFEATFHLDGHGSSFGAEESVVLQAFVFRLEKENWDPTWKESPLEKRLAYRLVNLLSMAPVNHRLDARTIEVPAPPGKDDALDSSADSSPVERVQDTGKIEQEEIQFTMGGCPYGGTIYVGIQCMPPHLQWIPHTACPEHGLINQLLVVGRSFGGSCLGRCGFSCSNNGYGKYYLDCAAHDACCREHGGCLNPNHWACGDEYDAAAPETLFGTINCRPPPPDCVISVNESVTRIVGLDGDSWLSPRQLRHPLERRDVRPESTIFLEEWAVVSMTNGGPTVKESSTAAFGRRLASETAGFISGDREPSTILVVEAAEHVHNARYIPTPSLEPFVVDVGRLATTEAQSFWFRAEVDTLGRVDRVMFLEPALQLPRARVEAAIRESLHLRYEDGRRHRTVAFGAATLTEDGRLAVGGGLAIVPQCCCRPPCEK